MSSVGTLVYVEPGLVSSTYTLHTCKYILCMTIYILKINNSLIHTAYCISDGPYTYHNSDPFTYNTLLGRVSCRYSSTIALMPGTAPIISRKHFPAILSCVTSAPCLSNTPTTTRARRG